MKVQSISAFEVGLPANTHGTPENTTERRSIQKQDKVAVALPNEPAKQNPKIEAEAAPVLVNGQGLSLRFKTDDVSGIRVIEVVDRESGDVVRQIPPEEVVDFVRRFQDNKGNFVSRRL